MTTPFGVWLAFHAVVLALLALDLGVFHRKPHEVTAKEAAFSSAIWVGLALAFGGLVWHAGGQQMALEYYTGWLIEKSLSVDNLFVFVLIFSYFKVPPALQHRVLFWGILGALLLRGVMIGAGTYLLHHFHWVIYIFGGLLLLTALRLLSADDAHQPTGLRLVALARRAVPLAEEYSGGRFVVRATTGGPSRMVATPLLLVLLIVEASDVVFAVDSIPAIFAVTTNPFIVYTSNVFAILGLRALYFLLADMIPRFHLLRPVLSLVLLFVGAKMLLGDVIEVPVALSLSVIATLLTGGVILSILRPSGLEPTRPDGHKPGSELVGP